jgi:hypothetical protein
MSKCPLYIINNYATDIWNSIGIDVRIFKPCRQINLSGRLHVTTPLSPAEGP